MNDFFRQTLSDIKVELSDVFDRNFERKAFFDAPWPKRKRQGRGTTLIVSGRLRRSIKSHITSKNIAFTSDAPYASIHNQGGTVPITRKMRRYFWAMHYKNMAGVSFSIKTQQPTTKKSARLNETAMYWRNMALHKGNKITIPQRQFIGAHSRVDGVVEACATKNIKALTKELDIRFKQKLNSI